MVPKKDALEGITSVLKIDEPRTFPIAISAFPFLMALMLTASSGRVVPSDNSVNATRDLSDKSINNIWTSFLVSGISKLTDDGVLAMILPLELLQVKFTEEIRNLLINEFQRMEIFTFNELQFQECKGQDTVLLIGYKAHDNQGTFYTNINSLEDLENGNFEFYENTALGNSDRKWTHHFITPKEYEFLESLKNRLHNVTYYINNKAGIVTAANNFFIVNSKIGLFRFQLQLLKFQKYLYIV